MRVVRVLPLQRQQHEADTPAQEEQRHSTQPIGRLSEVFELAKLFQLRTEANARHDNWLRLYQEPDLWTNPEKRKQMIRARWEYQEALLAHLDATSQQHPFNR